MALVIKDRVKESSTTTGTGTYTLAGAEAGHQTFSAIGDGNTTYYAATDGTYWEVGIGTYTASGTTLARTTILSSSNSNNAVNWTAGQKLIFVTQPSSKANYLDANGYVSGTEFNTHIDFNTTTSNKPSHAEGRLFYDKDFGALGFYNQESDITLQVGQEEYIYCYNNSGSTIANGKAVYISGEANNQPTIELAIASDTILKARAVGLATHSIENNTYGYVTVRGLVKDVDTSALTVGSPVYVSPTTAGALQTASPTYPNFPTEIGVCLISNASTGCIYVESHYESFESLRVTGNSHFDADVTVDGDLTVNGTQTITNSNNINLSGAFNYFNSGDTIGESGTTFTGSGLDDAIFTGHYNGTASNKTFKVKITTLHTGLNEDFFIWSTDNFTTQSAQIEITGNDQALEDNISVKFNATRGHTINDVWSGTASPVNVDTGIASNRNTGTSGVGYTHVGFYYDVSTNYWTLFDEYSPSPSGVIDPTHASFEYGTLKAGDFIGSLTGNVTGNLTGNVTGAVTGNVTGNLTGDVTGDVTGNITGNSTGVHTGNVTGNVTGNLTGNVTSTGTNSFGTATLGDWTITEDANGKLSFAHSGTVKMTVDDTGTIAVANDVLTDETF